jgi:hypothetical protein
MAFLRTGSRQAMGGPPEHRGGGYLPTPLACTPASLVLSALSTRALCIILCPCPTAREDRAPAQCQHAHH